MRFFAFIVIMGLVVVVGIQLFGLLKDNRVLTGEVEELRTENQALVEAEQKLRSDIEYFADPENLSKELRAQFDYKRPNETLIKIQ
jgi:cell division protein FtsB